MSTDLLAGLQIHIEQLELAARVGVPEQERAEPQRLLASITFAPLRDTAGRKDEITATVDYVAVADETRRFVSTRDDKLIETLAEGLAHHLLQKFSILKVRVEIRKFVLPGADHVAVTVERAR